MQQSFWHKKIPNLFVFALLIGSLGTIFWLSNNAVIFRGRAAPNNAPENIRIANVSDTTFTVSYTTTDAVFGTLAYGTDGALGNVGYDDRDQISSTSQNYFVHHITIKALLPQTTYYFSIQSGSETFTDNGTLFQITTAPKITTVPPPALAPVAGKIISPTGQAEITALVLMTADGTQTLSTLTKPDGTFVLPVNGLLDQPLTQYASLTNDTKLTLLVTDGLNRSEAVAFYSQTNPLPFITVSKNYEFTISPDALLDTNVDASSSASVQEDISDTSGDTFPSFTAFEAPSDDPKILTPKKDQTFNDQQPTFEGIAVPNKTVEIVINSETPITATVKADSKGNWEYRPSKKLTPGKHTVTITTRDRFNLVKTITQSFTVFAEGSQFTEPSVSPAAPSPTPIQSAPTKIPTAVPTTPQATPTIAPTAVPTVVSAVTAQPTQIVAKPPIKDINSGNSSVLLLSFVAIGSIAIGLLLFFLSRSTSL